MALDPELVPIVDYFESLGLPDPDTLTAEALRDSMVLPEVADPTPVAGITDRRIPGPGGDIPVRVYQPAGSDIPPVLMLFHGGGWVMGGLATHDEIARQLCAGSGALVVSVAYRLAPETPFPGGLEDCYAATCWAAEQAAALGAAGDRLAVAGDSAGGNLAAAVCLLARERGGPELRHQALVYPVTDRDFSLPSYRVHADGPLLTRAMMAWFWDQYLADPAQASEPLAAPLKADLRGLPAATVITAGHDPLHDEGERYAARLRRHGVAVEHRDFEGMMHGFLAMTEAVTQARSAMDYLCHRLHLHLAA